MKPLKIVSATHIRLIRERYAQGEGFHTIGHALGHCDAVIRRILTDAGVKIRLRGRPVKK